MCCARAALGPVPDGAPYRVYKGAPDVLKSMEAHGDCVEKRNISKEVASSWWYLHSKGEQLHDHRPILPISLLNVKDLL